MIAIWEIPLRPLGVCVRIFSVMKSLARLAFVPVFFFLFGCGGMKAGLPVRPGDEIAPVVKRLGSGGKLLIIPFSAGEGVEASRELDQIALMIVKGIGEELERTQAPFVLVSEKESREADFILEGHISQQNQPGGFHKWMPGGKTLQLGVQLEVKKASSGDRLWEWASQVRSSRGENDWRKLAYLMGQEIAKKLAKATQ